MGSATINQPVGNTDYTQSTVAIIGAGISGLSPCLAILILTVLCC